MNNYLLVAKIEKYTLFCKRTLKILYRKHIKSCQLSNMSKKKCIFAQIFYGQAMLVPVIDYAPETKRIHRFHLEKAYAVFFVGYASGHWYLRLDSGHSTERLSAWLSGRGETRRGDGECHAYRQSGTGDFVANGLSEQHEGYPA